MCELELVIRWYLIVGDDNEMQAKWQEKTRD